MSVPLVEYRGHEGPRVSTVFVYRGDRVTLASTSSWELAKGFARLALEKPG